MNTIRPVLALSVFLLYFQGNPQPDIFDTYTQEIEGSELVINMVPVMGGTFKMGSPNGNPDEGPAHQVYVDDFWMASHETTWDLYQLFAEARNDTPNTDYGGEIQLEIDGIASATTPYVDMSHGMGKKGYPVVNVTQHAALTFCKWLSAKTGYFYRLPTEAEWEYAARAGSSGDYFFGDELSELDAYAWYASNSNNKYQPVGLKKPNPLGLYDIYGNVAEWTLDQYCVETYKDRAGKETKNPWVRPTQLYPRVVRGGSWQDEAEALRVSSRRASDPRWKRIDPQIPKSQWWFTNAPHVGFRVVRPKITPPASEIEKYWLEAIDDY